MVDSCRGFDEIEQLQYHQNEEIYAKAKEVIQSHYFGKMSELEQELEMSEMQQTQAST